jgi:hypothetical protein
MMSELITWLRQQLDEDEASATAWARCCWHMEACDDTGDFLDRFSAARQLAEVEAKREILDLHAPFAGYKGRVQCGHCAGLCHSDSGLRCEEPADAMYPCENVTLLAQPYAGKPGWREEWRA